MDISFGKPILEKLGNNTSKRKKNSFFFSRPNSDTSLKYSNYFSSVIITISLPTEFLALFFLIFMGVMNSESQNYFVLLLSQVFCFCFFSHDSSHCHRLKNALIEFERLESLHPHSWLVSCTNVLPWFLGYEIRQKKVRMGFLFRVIDQKDLCKLASSLADLRKWKNYRDPKAHVIAWCAVRAYLLQELSSNLAPCNCLSNPYGNKNIQIILVIGIPNTFTHHPTPHHAAYIFTFHLRNVRRGGRLSWIEWTRYSGGDIGGAEVGDSRGKRREEGSMGGDAQTPKSWGIPQLGDYLQPPHLCTFPNHVHTAKLQPTHHHHYPPTAVEIKTDSGGNLESFSKVCSTFWFHCGKLLDWLVSFFNPNNIHSLVTTLCTLQPGKRL
ncbi:hypothetical protein VP01_1778g1 [Puccinia sorghi]|uniref:Uncharacterized protein n=1 Tax=Puccinia sorghi TaxID=27349 RepID=A0A0L6VEM7_9BASI|nr:hypothetical protein VP01_1778g1 [Puccinia sorghi]